MTQLNEMLKTLTSSYFPTVKDVAKARHTLKEILCDTPLQENLTLSERYQARIFLKREDLQFVRSYKIRGAYNKIRNLNASQLEKGLVCASAGNHAQGVAYSCQRLKIFGKIYMPTTTPKQKIARVKMLGKDHIEIRLVGDTFDAAYLQALKDHEKNDQVFIHPFDDPKIIEGQATVGLEILQQAQGTIDYVFVPIGGGGLAAGVGSYFRQLSPNSRIIGVEPEGAPSMSRSLTEERVVTLENIDRFVDGASVKKVGEFTFEICRKALHEVKTVSEGKVCTTILDLYNAEAIVAEPAGALSIAALDLYAEEIHEKNVVCVLSGGNNDITRTEEIRERSLLYEGLKHYFIVRFPQRAGALKQFVNEILSPQDDIAYFQYSKKNAKEEGPAVIGIELADRRDFSSLTEKMKNSRIPFQYINENPDLFHTLI
ncbi:MAG: threonine ammonia-lyase [Flavobacteriales bacterium Tduv]